MTNTVKEQSLCRLTSTELESLERIVAYGKQNNKQSLIVPLDQLDGLIAELLYLRDHSDAAILRQRNEELLSILKEAASPHPCSLDHDGFCQEHGCQSPCLASRIREAVDFT